MSYVAGTTMAPKRHSYDGPTPRPRWVPTTLTRPPPANGDDCGLTLLITGAMLKNVAVSLENCTPSSVTCTCSMAVVVYATDGHVMVLAAWE